MKHLKKFNESIKDIYSLISGNKYKITFPCYDDYEEGLTPEIETVKIIKKVPNGYLVKNDESGDEYVLRYLILNDAEIELYSI